MTRLLYVADPMCSWCFGFAPTVEALRARLREEIRFEWVLGGLAPDSNDPMPAETRGYIQSAWREVEARSGVRFNWSYWDQCEPRRSTWPACRAVLLAEDRAQELFDGIQRAYYQEAKDPSDLQTLEEVAVAHGIERADFHSRLNDPATRARLQEHFELRDRLGANSFPSLGLERNGHLQLLSRGWIERDALFEIARREGLLREE